VDIENVCDVLVAGAGCMRFPDGLVAALLRLALLSIGDTPGGV
jgi:hypothetical protein